MVNIVLVGDSTLDNEVWVEDGMTVTAQLKNLRPQDKVINLSVDGFTTDNVLNGGFRDKAVTSPNHQHIYYQPLEKLKKIKSCHHIILSVGGNDFREELQTLITKTPTQRLDAITELGESISAKYITIVHRLQNLKPKAKITVLLQYTPCAQKDLYLIYFLMSAIANEKTLNADCSIYFPLAWHYIAGLTQYQSTQAVECLHDIMAKVYQPIFEKLISKNISVIDLASSFNPNDPNLYVSQIEPSSSGAALISTMISHAIDQAQTESTLYSKPTQCLLEPIKSIPLCSVKNHWRPGHVYPDALTARNTFINMTAPSTTQTISDKTKTAVFFKKTKSIPLENKTLDELIEDVIHHRATGKTLNIMQQLKFVNCNNQFNNKSSVYTLVSDSVRSQLQTDAVPT
jgi:hypothetical protein